MKFYIAGKMTGIPLFNFPAFDKKRDQLLDCGYEIVSPADIDREHGFDPSTLPADYDWTKIPPGAGTREEIIKRDIAALLTCDGIYLLPGWEDSVGARAEAAIARWSAMYITYGSDTKPPCKDTLSEILTPKILPEQIPATKDSNPKDNVGSRKPSLSAVPCAPLFEAGAALAYGGRKYGRHNWRDRGVRASVYYDAVMRHLMAWWEGEDIDAIEHGGSGLSHIAHAIAGLMVYRDAEIKGNVTDDRPIAYGSPSRWLEASTAETCKRYPNPVAPFTEKPL